MCSDNAAYVKHGLYINGIIIAETERKEEKDMDFRPEKKLGFGLMRHGGPLHGERIHIF